MIKHFIALCLFIIVAFCNGGAKAQNRYELTVQAAVDLAFSNVIEVKNANIDYQIQKANNREITGRALPQVAGDASLTHYLSLPKILFPDGSESGIYNVLINEGLLPSGTKIPVPGIQEVSFQQPWNSSFGGTVSQLLFQPDVFVGLQARKTALAYYQSNVELVKERVKDSAYRRYYAILIAEKQVSFIDSGVKRLQKLYHDDSIMYVNGFAEKLDMDKVQVQLTNLQTTRNILANNIELAYAALKYAIGVKQSDTVVLKEDLSEEQIKTDILSDTFNYEDRKEIISLGYTRELQELDVKRYKLGYIPTVSAFYSYNVQSMGQKFLTDNSTFWFKSSYVGLNVNVPLFDGFQRKYKVQQARLNLEKVDNNIENVKQVIDLQLTASKATLTNSLLNLDAQERNVQLAENVYNTTKKKFEQGLGSSFEVLQADNDWQTAQSNYFTALYNAIIAKVSYQSALGKLP